MEKPTTILLTEFRQNMENLINSSGLPKWLVRDEVEFRLLPLLKKYSNMEYEADAKIYAQALEKEVNKDGISENNMEG